MKTSTFVLVNLYFTRFFTKIVFNMPRVLNAHVFLLFMSRLEARLFKDFVHT